MPDRKVWKASEIEDVFRTLHLSIGSASSFTQFEAAEVAGKEVLITRLSDSSNPPPTGRMPDADLERSFN
ncbi:hypothetical protein [Leptolyngbya sp. 7M]|uniref:hypothetical protein n=1 Tax=Leptolyngbya sp. 7M TaxID=2812896 RepID=UPI001B8B67D8|nr:hypothetical protein [Leptolyngbya sp. 7M]QYO65972.1 hypothetical protein JVX88_04000 [Leptolyngbya sp. 7M]